MAIYTTRWTNRSIKDFVQQLTSQPSVLALVLLRNNSLVKNCRYTHHLPHRPIIREGPRTTSCSCSWTILNLVTKRVLLRKCEKILVAWSWRKSFTIHHKCWFNLMLLMSLCKDPELGLMKQIPKGKHVILKIVIKFNPERVFFSSDSRNCKPLEIL